MDRLFHRYRYDKLYFGGITIIDTLDLLSGARKYKRHMAIKARFTLTLTYEANHSGHLHGLM